MKKIFPSFLFALVAMLLSSCAAIEGIFKAGMWSGIIVVVLVIAVIIWILAKLSGGNKE